jgi:hypothetical protein
MPHPPKLKNAFSKRFFEEYSCAAVGERHGAFCLTFLPAVNCPIPETRRVVVITIDRSRLAVRFWVGNPAQKTYLCGMGLRKEKNRNVSNKKSK